MADLHPPKEIAAGAVDRLCAYDAVGAPGDYAATSERVAEFLAEFVLVLDLGWRPSPRPNVHFRRLDVNQPTIPHKRRRKAVLNALRSEFAGRCTRIRPMRVYDLPVQRVPPTTAWRADLEEIQSAWRRA